MAAATVANAATCAPSIDVSVAAFPAPNDPPFSALTRDCRIGRLRELKIGAERKAVSHGADLTGVALLSHDATSHLFAVGVGKSVRLYGATPSRRLDFSAGVRRVISGAFGACLVVVDRASTCHFYLFEHGAPVLLCSFGGPAAIDEVALGHVSDVAVVGDGTMAFVADGGDGIVQVIMAGEEAGAAFRRYGGLKDIVSIGWGVGYGTMLLATRKTIYTAIIRERDTFKLVTGKERATLSRDGPLNEACFGHIVAIRRLSDVRALVAEPTALRVVDLENKVVTTIAGRGDSLDPHFKADIGQDRLFKRIRGIDVHELGDTDFDVLVADDGNRSVVMGEGFVEANGSRLAMLTAQLPSTLKNVVEIVNDYLPPWPSRKRPRAE